MLLNSFSVRRIKEPPAEHLESDYSLQIIERPIDESLELLLLNLSYISNGELVVLHLSLNRHAHLDRVFLYELRTKAHGVRKTGFPDNSIKLRSCLRVNHAAFVLSLFSRSRRISQSVFV